MDNGLFKRCAAFAEIRRKQSSFDEFWMNYAQKLQRIDDLNPKLVQFSEDDEFYSATANSVSEAAKLIEQGFDYVCDIDAVKLFRKRK